MDEESITAQETIKQILSGMGIQKVVSVDDFYTVDDSHYDAVALFKTARSKQGIEYSELIPREILDAPEDIWTRRLEAFWSEVASDIRLAILNELVAKTGYKNPPSDIRDLSLLKDLIPEEMFVAMGPDEWDRNRESILKEAQGDQGVLCLFDQDLHLAGRPESAGMTLLQKTLETRGGGHIICGLLTQTINKDAELLTARKFASEKGLSLDQFLPLSKDRLRDDPMEFADGLKMTVLNYERERLSKQVTDISEHAGKQAQEQMNELDVYDFEHIVIRSSEEESVWEPDTLFRLFDLFRYNAFREMALTREKRESLYGDIERMRAIRDIKTLASQQYPSGQVQQIQHTELFDAPELLNPAHQPLDLGDIFEVGNGQSYILLAQPCDLVVGRSSRVKIVTLVKIQTYEAAADGPRGISSFRLDHFQPGKKTFVKFRNSFQISLDVLDLAVFSDDGQCRISLPDADVDNFPTLHKPWRKRFEDLVRYFQTTHQEFQRIPYRDASNYQKRALRCVLLCSKKNIELNYDDNGTFTFGIRRVGRYRLPLSVQLLSAYFAFRSRNPQKHDLTRT